MKILVINPNPTPNNQKLQICVDGLVGKTAADRDRGNDNKNTLPEAKKCYSSQCLERCAGVLAVSQLPLLMDPVKKVTFLYFVMVIS